MHRFLNTLFTMFIILPLFSQAGEKVIYGVNNLIESSLATEIYSPFSNAVGAIVGNSIIEDDGENITLKQDVTFETAFLLCPDQPYLTQPVNTLCTAFLITDDLVLTAGHCIDDYNDCRNSSIIFDYELGVKNKSLNRAQCQYIVKRIYPTSYDSMDFALLKLDRKMSHISPVKLNTGRGVQKDDELFMIGHPAGLPKKVATSAFVKRNTYNTFFSTNLDAFISNSGSPVFNRATGKVEGILVRGSQDFVMTDDDCQVIRLCQEEPTLVREGESSDYICTGEDVLKIKNVINEIKDFL
jgi:S1-C subfamily serine protease